MNRDIITLPEFPEQVSFSTKPPRTSHVWVEEDPELKAARERWRAQSPPPWYDPKWFDREPSPPPRISPVSKAHEIIEKILDALSENPTRELAKKLSNLTKQLIKNIDYFNNEYDLDLTHLLIAIKETTEAINQALIDGGDQVGTLQVIQRRLDRLTRGILTRPTVNAGDAIINDDDGGNGDDDDDDDDDEDYEDDDGNGGNGGGDDDDDDEDDDGNGGNGGGGEDDDGNGGNGGGGDDDDGNGGNGGDDSDGNLSVFSQNSDDDGGDDSDGNLSVFSQNSDDDRKEEAKMVDGSYIQEKTINGITYITVKKEPGT